ncbi:WAT1-related protein At5g07050-like isoform X2 [Asparagus officinalis]|uniref:WAT1-related protein At5g07050-like isoform X2 n=1 Tax=Asparagus officinalis TaxID=4686 RepID=UPI00098E1639|nr:WAT1-related protein At5g07050-like isoform X2 [Asparagus officinalis]
MAASSPTILGLPASPNHVQGSMSSMKAIAPYLAMIVSTLAYGGTNILGKLAIERGLNCFVLNVYRHLIAMMIFGPLSYVLERNQRPPLSLSILMKIFVLTLFGATIHLNLFYIGLDYTPPTVASALSSVIPVLTFTLAVLFRMEKVKIKSAKGIAKLIGALVCITGALLFTFWQGPLLPGFVKRPLIIVQGKNSGHGSKHYKDDWIKGSLLIFIANATFSVWFILQAKVCEVYSARLMMNTLIGFFASLQSAVAALIFDRNASSWKLEWNLQLITVLYSGIVISGLSYYLQTFCISKKGPVFAAMFSPLNLVLVALFSAFFFAERLHLSRFL